MATLALQQIANTGIVPTFAAAAGAGDEFPNNGKTYIEVINGGGSPINVTIASQYQNPPPGTDNEDIVVAVANGVQKKIGPFNQVGFNDADGNVQVTYSGVTSVTVGVFTL